MLIWSIYHSGSFDSYKEENLTLCRDMWNDVYCFLPREIRDPRGGGATVFYPGQKGKGITNDNIICESIRLRYLREGGEYYELLTTREQQLKTAAEKAGILFGRTHQRINGVVLLQRKKRARHADRRSLFRQPKSI